jgi:hypothetical protein
MANASKSGVAGQGGQSSPPSGLSARKLVPLEKRLGKLRKEEAKRRRQLDVVQARSDRTKGQLTEIIASVNDWVQHPAGAGAMPNERQKGR